MSAARNRHWTSPCSVALELSVNSRIEVSKTEAATAPRTASPPAASR